MTRNRSEDDQEMNAAHALTGHLALGDLAAYLEGRLAHESRAGIEDHLSECPECRSELGSAARALREIPHAGQRTLRFVRRAPALAAAAAVVLLVGAAVVADRLGNDTPLLRGERSVQTEGVPRLGTVEPAMGTAVPGDSVRFVWRAAAGQDALFSLTLTDREGDVLWKGTTRDTFLMLPSEVALKPATTYYWYVDALLEGAASATTRIQEFRTEP